MVIPDEPPIGSLIACEYLWLSQRAVREDAVKVYPAALIFAKKLIGGVTLGMPSAYPTGHPRPPKKIWRYPAS